LLISKPVRFQQQKENKEETINDMGREEKEIRELKNSEEKKRKEKI